MEKLDGASAGEMTRKLYAPVTRDVVETVAATGGFARLTDAIRASGLVKVLGARGPFTFFAPTDAAFSKLPAESQGALLRNATRLAAIINYHVIPGYFDVKDLYAGEVETLQGTSLTMLGSGAQTSVNGVRIVQADLVATNGVVHAIDDILLPKKWRLA
jgi:uncharacterized surface protein with fasciclin (FAS1) repeats